MSLDLIDEVVLDLWRMTLDLELSPRILHDGCHAIPMIRQLSVTEDFAILLANADHETQGAQVREGNCDAPAKFCFVALQNIAEWDNDVSNVLAILWVDVSGEFNELPCVLGLEEDSIGVEIESSSR